MDKTFLFLLAAHLLADFVLQDAGVAARKRELAVWAIRIAIVAFAAWLALASFRMEALAAVTLIALTHAAMDWARLRQLGDGLWPLVIDQVARLSLIALVAVIWPNLWADGAWGRLPPEGQSFAVACACVLSGGIVAVHIG